MLFMTYHNTPSVKVHSNKRIFLVVTVLSVMLFGCDNHQTEQDIISNHSQNIQRPNNDTTDAPDEGSKLVDVAGQATVPIEHSASDQAVPVLSKEEIPYIGRYHVYVPCSDPVALCKQEEGQIDYIVSLLPDGSAFRQRVSVGRIRIDERQNTKTYNPDTWHLDKENQQIVVKVFTGGNLYFNILDKNHIQANVNKIVNENNGLNRKQLGEEFVLPHKGRILTRLP